MFSLIDSWLCHGWILQQNPKLHVIYFTYDMIKLVNRWMFLL
uniref:Uncharacterized protein n=1 Tax=Anguilla anguilla TaxID=7936 RepID=A0A0E9TII7_ANGAN